MSHIKLNLSGHFNEILHKQGFTTLGLHVDLKDPELPQKIVEFLKEHIDSSSVVTCVMPGLAPLATMVLVAIHGITGNFPSVVTLVRAEDGFVPAGEPFSLQDYRNQIARNKGRKNTVVL